MTSVKRVIMSLAILGLSSTAANAKSPKKKASTETDGFILNVSTKTPQNLAELITHFEEIDQKMQGLSASFAQSLSLSDADISQHVEGTLKFQKPNHIHLVHLKPERQTIISDGETLWIHRIDQNQVIKSSLADWKKSDPLINNLMDFGNLSRMLSTYDVSYDSGTLQVILKPKEKTDHPFMIKLILAGPYLFPMEMELDVAQTKIRTTFAKVLFNPKFDRGEFLFTPPDQAQLFDHFVPPQGPSSQ
jgi:outer membrane lipoprotein carrier protein